jgi:16S rRNA (cytosine967-C5)-methyltransferase
VKNDARELSIKILINFENTKKHLNEIQNKLFLNKNYSTQVKSRSKVLTNEIIRFKGRIDYIMEQISGRRNKNFNKNLISILRLAFYEILFDPNIPDYASVNTAVDLTKIKLNKKAAGLTNAVLRKLVRTKKAKKNWDEKFKTHKNWNSFPTWIQNRFINQHNEINAKLLFRSFNKSPEIFVRNDSKLSIEILKDNLKKDNIKSLAFSESFLKIKSGSKNILDNKLFQSGQISIQDPSSYGIIECLNIKKGDVILDVCAAPGTKSLAMSFLVGEKGKILSSDINNSRVEMGREDLKRHNRKNIKWSVMDATKDIFPIVDKILIDAPCSGLGVLRRKPDIRWRRKEKEIISFSNLQLEILCHMSNFLKPGGVIVYGTCSIDKKENFNVVQNFLKINKDFKLDKIPSTINSEMIDKNLCFSTIKVIDNLDGMFAARLKKYD